MNKKITLAGLLCFFISLSYGQTTFSPNYSSRDAETLDINKVEITEDYTIISFTHTAPSTYTNGGWVQLNGGIYLKEIGGDKTYPFVKAEGITISPNKYYNKKVGEKLYFKVYFKKLDYGVTNINIIECEESVNCFNFYGVKLNNGTSQNTTPSYQGTNSKFRVDYNIVSFYNDKTKTWSEFKSGDNTFVININDNGDIMHIKASGKQAIYKKLSGVRDNYTKDRKHYQIIKALDEDGDVFSFQIFDDTSIGLKMIYGDVMIQFAKQ